MAQAVNIAKKNDDQMSMGRTLISKLFSTQQSSNCKICGYPIFYGASSTHWGRNPQFIQKLSFWKSHFWQNSHFQNHIFDKIHNFKISFFTKFTFSKSHSFTKFTFSKSHFSQNSHFSYIIFKGISA